MRFLSVESVQTYIFYFAMMFSFLIFISHHWEIRWLLSIALTDLFEVWGIAKISLWVPGVSGNVVVRLHFLASRWQYLGLTHCQLLSISDLSRFTELNNLFSLLFFKIWDQDSNAGEMKDLWFTSNYLKNTYYSSQSNNLLLFLFIYLF